MGRELTGKEVRAMAIKWIYVRIKGWFGLLAVKVPKDLTVAELKILLGLSRRSNLFVPAHFLPLPGEVQLYNLIEDFETVYVEP